MLFGNDVRVLAFSKAADPVFEVLMSMSFVIFLFEFVVYSWSKTTVHVGVKSPLSDKLSSLTRGRTPSFKVSGYLFGFYFWLDCLAVASMFPDLPWIAGPLGLNALSLGAHSEVGATAKLGRVARMVRLVRSV